MNITDHIVESLKSGKNVELNGIGAFVVNTTDAYMDEASNTFFPKSQTVEFHPYTEDRGNIVSLIARKECVDESTALQMWHNYSEALLDKLNTLHSHTFPELGDLKYENGEYRFIPIEGLNLLGNTDVQPITGISKFASNPNDDPFAMFDNPDSFSNANMETEEMPESGAETVQEPSDTPSPAVEENPKNEPDETSDPIPVPEQSETTATTNTPAEPEPAPYPAPAEKKQEQPADIEAPVDKKIGDDLQKILDDEPDTPSDNKKKKRSRGTKIVIILLIVLLLLLWGGAAFYYFFIYKNNGKIVSADNTEQVSQTDSSLTSESTLKSNDDAVAETDNDADAEDETAPISDETEAGDQSQETASEPAATADTDNGALNKSTSDYEYNKYNSMFAYDLSTVAVSDPSAVETNTQLILKRLAGRIDRFAKGKQYSSATSKLTSKLRDFVSERLEDKFGIHPDEFHIADLMPYTTTNFVRNYMDDELQTRKQRRARYEVIAEIFENNILGQYLDELINSGEVSKDVVKAAPAPVYTAPVYSNPKQGFDVIAGTYRDKQSAMRMASSLRSKGAGAYVIERGGLYFVSAGSAPSQTAAERVLFQLKTWYTSNLSIKKW